MRSEFEMGDYGLGDLDSDRGIQVMEQFRSAMNGRYGLSITIDDLVNKYGENAIATIGFATNVGGTGWFGAQTAMSSSQTQNAMNLLAQNGGGQIPSSVNGFTSALSAVASDPNTAANIWGSITYTTLESAKDVVTGATKIGDTLITTGNTILNTAQIYQYAIYAIPAVLIWMVWKNRNKIANAATGGALGIGSAITKRAKQAISGE